MGGPRGVGFGFSSSSVSNVVQVTGMTWLDIVHSKSHGCPTHVLPVVTRTIYFIWPCIWVVYFDFIQLLMYYTSL